MTDTTDYVEELISTQLEHSIIAPSNHDIYEPRLTPDQPPNWPPVPFNYQPHCVYFYYIRLDANNALRVDEYFYPNGPIADPPKWQPIGSQQIEPIIAQLAANARSGAGSAPNLSTNNFQNVVWDRISYIAVVVDEAAWKLHKLSQGQGAMVFNFLKGALNGSFFDAKDILISIPSANGETDNRTGFYFINHMTVENVDGSFAIDEGQHTYTFDIYFDVMLSGTTNSTIVILDPTGTNQGPPQKP